MRKFWGTEKDVQRPISEVNSRQEGTAGRAEALSIHAGPAVHLRGHREPSSAVAVAVTVHAQERQTKEERSKPHSLSRAPTHRN